MAPGSCRNVNWNLFTAILNLLKSSFKKRYRTSLCTLAQSVAEAVSCGLKQAKINQASRLNLKIFAVPFLPKSLVKNLVSRTVCCPQFFGQYSQSAVSVGPQTNLNVATQYVLHLWARKPAKIRRSCPLRDRLNVNLTKLDVWDF